MQAIVLVGGEGTRLRPLTDDVPKPALTLVDRPFLAYMIEWLAGHGVTEAVLACGFLPDVLREALGDGERAGVRLTYVTEPDRRGTAGAIRFAADEAGIDDTFVVANGDILTDLDVGALVEFHRARQAQATIHLIPVDDPSSFGVVALDDAGLVERFVEKPAPGTAPSNLINAGTYVLEASVLARIPALRKSSIERVTFPAIAADRGLFAMATEDAWIDTGRPELYLQANLDELDRDPAAGVHAGANVSTDATIEHSVIGPRALVARGALVERSVVLPDAVIGANAVVRDSVVMGTVGPGAWVERCVLGARGVIAADERVADERRPAPEG